MSTYGATTSKGVRVVGEDVSKGVLRQGVIRPIARVNPSRTARKTVHASSEVVGKGIKIKGLRLGKAKPPAPSPRAPYQSVTNIKPGGRLYGNVQGVGKADVDKALNPRGLLAAAKAPMQLLRGTASANTGVRAGGLLNGVRAGRAGMGASAVASPANAGARLGQRVGMSIGANPMKSGLAAGTLGTAAVMGGNGHRNQQPFAPLAPMYGGFGKALNESQSRRLFQVGQRKARGPVEEREEKAINGRRHLISHIDNRAEGSFNRHGAGWPSEGLPRAARRRGVTTEQMMDELNRRAIGTRKEETYFSRTNVFKRSYDPENERHFRTGAYTAAAAGGGAALTGMGVRDVRRDSKGLRELPMVNPRIVPPELSALDPKGKPRPPVRLQARLAEIKNAEAHNAKVGELRGKLKGVQVTRRSGAKLGAGLALLGTAGALARNRHEERWD